MELGLSSFAETTPDPVTGVTSSHGQRLREIVEEIVLADEVGLDVYGLGEHHRPDYAASAPRSSWPPPPRAPRASGCPAP